MKKTLFFGLALLLTTVTFAQVGIGTKTPDASAMLHLNGDGTKGLLLPRITTFNRNATDGILSPEGGILIYNSTTGCLEVSLNGNEWRNLCTGAKTATTAGTTTAVGKVGIGLTNPDPRTILDVQSTTKGVLIPTASAAPAGVTGMMYYNTTNNEVQIYNGTSWVKLTTL